MIALESSRLFPVLLALLAAAVVVAWVRAGIGGFGGADFEIRCRPGGRVSIRGKLPKSKRGAIRQFFARDLEPARTVAVRGWYGTGQTLRIRFAGRLSPGQRQRARNFLITQLR